MIRIADENEIRLIYGWIQKQFEPGEVKPLWRILRMAGEGWYRVYGMWEGEELRAYALLARSKQRDVMLLDYFAVLPRLQGGGIGSAFLEALRLQCPNDTILLECEDVSCAPDEAERLHRQRRKRFYDRAGCRDSGVRMSVFGFDYRILYLLGDADAAEGMAEIYTQMLEKELYEQNIRFKRRVEVFGEGSITVLVHGVEDAEAERIAAALGVRIAVPRGIVWNRDLSPWAAEKVFPKGEPFTGGGEAYLEELRRDILPALGGGRLMIAGYSMGGMFALYAALSLGVFEAAASASGSMWFPGFTDWMRSAEGKLPRAYLSVGDREKLGKNPAFASIEDKTREAEEILQEKGTEVFFELNPGNHFAEPEKRLEKAIRHIVKEEK